MKKRRIGMATPVYNAERWIYPFLKLTDGLDRRVLVLGKEPFPWVAKEHGVSTVPDRTEALVRKCFPDVEIIAQNPIKDFGPDFWNQGHEYLSGDCDFIFRFDADEIIRPFHWFILLKHVRETEDEAIAIDFGKSAIEFYYDLDHGKKNEHETWVETRGLDNKHRYQGMGHYHGPNFIFMPPDFVIYHYTGFKRGEQDKEMIEKNKDIQWFSTPPEIKQFFEEGWKILEEL